MYLLQIGKIMSVKTEYRDAPPVRSQQLQVSHATHHVPENVLEDAARELDDLAPADVATLTPAGVRRLFNQPEWVGVPCELIRAFEYLRRTKVRA